jgi:magnesium transporter
MYGERIEAVEEQVLDSPEPHMVGTIHDIKHDLLAMRRAAWPLREALSVLYRDESDLIGAEARVFLRDAYDHTVQVIDVVETYRELASGLMEAYLSSISNRTNEVMRVLTIFASIFIPLTFVAGIYGMNFNTEISPWNMPELGLYWGYPLALGSMALAAVGLLTFFWRRGWLTGQGTTSRRRQGEPPS